MEKEGVIIKMKAESGMKGNRDHPVVRYRLPVGEEEIELNGLLDKTLRLEFRNRIYCIHCGNLTKKSFAQGYCYPCFIRLPETDACILRPELCQAHLGISRDMEWSEKNCLQDHFVYLAISSGLKVGVTRASQIPTRWIDQGAWKAIKIAMTPNRYLAGMIETELKKHFADKTNWRDMLRNKLDTGSDLLEGKAKAYDLIAEDLKKYFIENDEIQEFHYPVRAYPEKVKSFSFDKENRIEGILVGIKGQYLIFKDGRVLNIRKHNGYLVTIEY